MENNYQEAYTQEYFNQHNKIINNGAARLPICFCIDVSRSMRGLLNNKEEYTIQHKYYGTIDGIESANVVQMKDGFKPVYRIDHLKATLYYFLEKMSKIDSINESAIISIITFAEYANCIKDFSELKAIKFEDVKAIKVSEVFSDGTCMSKGIKMALNKLDEISRSIKAAGNECYKPILVFMSDGIPTDANETKDAIRELKNRIEKNEIMVIPISLGPETKESTCLDEMSSINEVLYAWKKEAYSNFMHRIKQIVQRKTSVVAADETDEVETSEIKEESEGKAESSAYMENKGEGNIRKLAEINIAKEFAYT